MDDEADKAFWLGEQLTEDQIAEMKPATPGAINRIRLPVSFTVSQQGAQGSSAPPPDPWKGKTGPTGPQGGYVLALEGPEIPVTDEMIAAGIDCYYSPVASQGDRNDLTAIYRAMAAKAPRPRTETTSEGYERLVALPKRVAALIYDIGWGERRLATQADVDGMEKALWEFYRGRDDNKRELAELRAINARSKEMCERQSALLGNLAGIIAAKDARIAELDTELALRPAALADPEPELAKPSPFRDFPSDPRRIGR